MAQTWRMARSDTNSSPRKPRLLDQAQLDALALRYVARYATTRAKLRAYLLRKIEERGWSGQKPPDVNEIVDRHAALGYVDDAGFAAARVRAFARRGYGELRIAAMLRSAGIENVDAAAALAAAHEGAYEAALHYARRRRIGPFARSPGGPEQRRRDYAAMMRAGHGSGVIKRVLECDPHVLDFDN
jgi:regulatory protein